MKHMKLWLIFLSLIMSCIWSTSSLPHTLGKSKLNCGNAKTEIYNTEILLAGRTYGVEPCLIASVIKAESDFDEQAVSPKGARGLMQLMPATARELGVRDSFDPVQNILGGTRYLKQMYEMFGSWRLALIAYNWGPGHLEKYGPNRMPKETRQYLERIERYYGTLDRN